MAFKTLSEPMPGDNHPLYEDLIVKQNVEEMLNHIIFLERDPSLRGENGWIVQSKCLDETIEYFRLRKGIRRTGAGGAYHNLR